jgi:hypothetical protein
METAQNGVTRQRWRMQRRVASMLLYVIGSAVLALTGLLPLTLIVDGVSRSDVGAILFGFDLLVGLAAVPMMMSLMLILAGVWLSPSGNRIAEGFWAAAIALIVLGLLAFTTTPGSLSPL